MIRRAIFRRRPFRWLWMLKATWLLWSKCQVEQQTFRDDWGYSAGLAEYMDDCDEYLSPWDAICEDMTYWESE